MKSWSFPVTAEVAERLSLKVNAVIVGAELAAVVCIVQVQVEVFPTWALPSFVTSSMVAVKDFRLAIASRRSARSVWESVMVRLAVPVDHVRAAKDTYTVEPFLMVT